MPRRPAPKRSAVDAPSEERRQRPRGNAPALPLARTDQSVAALAPRVRLSSSYSAALGVDLSEREAEDPDATRRAILAGLARRRQERGERLTVADALAASLVHRATNVDARDGVLAVRELADRTEGPVVQRTQDVSVRYVVSVTPAGAVGEGGLLPPSPEEWERSARGDWERARLSPPDEKTERV